MKIISSVNGVNIRITHERWLHITEEHPEMAGYYFDMLETITDPTAIYLGSRGEYLAIKEIDPAKYIVAIYKEIASSDGFLITVFLTRRRDRIERRERVWP